MAPEIVIRHKYQAANVDMFAAGVVLFIMYTGNIPFGEASPKDKSYKALATGRADSFWSVHSQMLSRDDDFFSPDFKHLIENLLLLNPYNRLDMEGVLNHPWMHGETPSPTEVREEMLARSSKVERAKFK